MRDCTPYGEVLRSYNNSSPNEKYKFTGKERDTETNLDYFGARFYDSELGRWTTVDPLASKYPAWSTYNYCVNNPIRLVDKDGMESSDSDPAREENDKKTQREKELQKKYDDMMKLVEQNNQSEQTNELIISVIWKESSFDQNAKGTGTSAVGLMQVTKPAAKDVGYKHSEVATDPAINIQAGSKYLQLRINWQKGDVLGGLNGYGTGKGYGDNILKTEKMLLTNPKEPLKALFQIHK